MELRGIPLWLVREYLEEAGGRARDDTHVAGNGWTATLEQIEDFTLGSLRIGQVRLTLEGDPDAVARLREFLEPKLLRAGG